MCGRFVRHSSLKLIEETFNVDTADVEAAPSFNVAPSQAVLAIVGTEPKRLVQFRWGLVPFWAKDPSIGYKMINARAETVAEKPSFRSAFGKRRCLVIADGFYEWKGPKGNKQPYLFTLRERGPFAFAGLWESWRDKKEPSELLTCAVITTPASPSVADVHDRMPAIPEPQTYDSWLDTSNHDVTGLMHILLNACRTQLNRRPVSRRVNDVRNNDPACMD